MLAVGSCVHDGFTVLPLGTGGELRSLIEPRHGKSVFALCKQQRRRSACASAQSDQRLCCSLPG